MQRYGHAAEPLIKCVQKPLITLAGQPRDNRVSSDAIKNASARHQPTCRLKKLGMPGALT